ncbi:hypothetical protein TESG_00538 [Trichophyton tonsurans CBS 112818]|uniref:Uncharacterized protein n=2 Tax=Trichophyton TaxID=5550 RepID=F2PQ94_TRIEC|nr:hypothetical protein TESG_00538 [Trichophyton tonsurans CBS 112818]EGE04062.1 hypothetical protein TEQG_03094 [Trichophyton equinum CBS 127.97]
MAVVSLAGGNSLHMSTIPSGRMDSSHDKVRAEPTLFRLPQHPGTNGRPATRHRGRRRTLSIVRIWTKVDASTENISLVYFTVSPVKRLCLVINGALAQTPPCINPDAEMTKPVNVRPL